MDMHALVGRSFARPRLAKDLTQERFPEISGFAQQSVSGIEPGRRNPTVVTLFHLAQALGASPVELFAPGEEASREVAKPPANSSKRK